MDFDNTEMTSIKLIINDIEHKLLSEDGRTCYLVLTNQDITGEILLDTGSDISILSPEKSQLNGGAIEFYIMYIRDQIMKLVRTNGFIKQTADKTLLLDATLESLKKDFARLPLFARKNATETYLSCKKFIGKVLKKWRKNIKLNNDTLAKLANKAYSHALKKGVQKRLNSRIATNADLEEEISNKINETIMTIDWVDLENKLPSGTDDYTCVVSCNNIIESMKNSDVMCLTFNISRSENSVASPDNIRINSICPSKISFNSFMDSVLFKLNADNTAHGGFDPNSKTNIIVGEARDEINAILPMYICPEHWSLSREYSKLSFGWMCTLDILGYDFLQMVSIPFALLSHVRSLDQTEFIQIYESAVYDVCRQICCDYPAYFNKIIEKANRYIDNRTIRTIDSIANNSIFLEQLNILYTIPLFAEKITLDLTSNDFIFYLVEEELRRWNKNFHGNPLIKSFDDDLLVKILGIDRKTLIDDPLALYTELVANKFTSSSLEVENCYRIGCELLTQNSTQFEQKINTDNSINFENNIIELDGYIDNVSIQAVTVLQKFYAPMEKILNIFEHTCGPDMYKKCTAFKENPQSLAICLQNIEHGENATRRASFENNTYCELNTITSAYDYIRKLRMYIIDKIKKEQIDKIYKKYSSAKNNNCAAIFCNATDIPTAMGAIKSMPSGAWMDFMIALSDHIYPLAQHKFNMLITGEYKNIYLVCPGFWFPSRKMSNRFYRTYGHIKMYPTTAESIEWTEEFRRKYD